MRWILPATHDPSAIVSLAEALQIPNAIAELLWRRGYRTPESAKPHLDPRLASLADPFLLPDMRAAVDRIFTAIDGGERIVLFGDYDVDGVTSLALLSRVLRAFGANVECFLPVREGEGYGLSSRGVERCRREYNPQLLVAVDCGTSAVSEVSELRAQGVDVVVLDHHECPSVLPECNALVNPKRGNHFQYLCSVGVVFKLSHAMLKCRKQEGIDLREFLDLVALGTLADLVPLQDENRTLVRRGLAQMGESKWIGVSALMRVAGVKPPLDSGDVGFKLGPRMNAAGRLGTARDALDLLLSEDAVEANQLAERLDIQNRDRRGVEDQVLREAEEQVALSFRPEIDAAIIVGASGWHPGVLGIVASRLMRKYYRPTIVVGFDETGMGKGSGRSIKGLPLVEALHGCRDLLDKYGGHEMAAGVSVRQENFEAFRGMFCEHAAKSLSADNLEPTVEIDAELLLEEVNTRMLTQYEALAPFGMGNPQPMFILRGVTPSESPRVLKEKHLQLSVRQGSASSRAMWFNAASQKLPPAPWDLAVELSRNEYQGVVSAQILVRAVRAAE
jgi:single-stranded-DNA-specific exonuclease